VTVDTIEAAAPVVDTARPWPGLDAFTEALSPFFFGRDAEAEELFRRVRRDVVTLLFGQSGLGKTSLLQAGLFPRLRWAGFLPILIRLDYSAEALSPAAQVKAAIKRAIAAADLSEATPIDAEESLWGYFHRAKRRLADYLGKEIVPVLVFDQFEEIFTQGLAGDDSRAASQSFLGELAELIENRPPEKLEQAIEANPDLVDDYLFDRQDYRIVLALREDFLASLESLRGRAPSLGRNRYRLRRMTGRQGLDAILNPAPGLVAPAVAQEIIRFIGSANPEDAFGVAGPAGSSEGFEVEPSLLSLVCRELNERRIARGLDQIGADLLAGSRDDIIEGFYERVLADQPAALRTFVEDRLLSDSGFRESITLDSARRALSDAGVPATALDQLVRRRLLRIEERLDVARVEIIHDVLTRVIRRSRDTRHLRQAEAAAAEREAAFRREQQRVRRAHYAIAAMAMLFLMTVGVAWWGWHASVEAKQQRALAEEQRTLAEQRRNFAEEQRILAEQQRNFAEEQRVAAAAASKRAEQNFDMAVTTADTMVSTVAERLRNLTGVSAATIKEILVSAERAFDEIAAAAPNSQHLRWRRAIMLISFADTYRTLGDTVEALGRAQTARSIMLVLINESPTNTDWQQTLCASHSWVGDVLSDQGKHDAALTEYRAYLDIAQRLTEKDPDNTEWQRGLSVSHEKVGNVLDAKGDLAGALAEYRIELAIMEPLAKRDRNNTDWQRFISVSHNKVGDVLQEQHNPSAALAEYRAGLYIIQSLAGKDPGNTQWQRDLSISHERVGNVLRDQGDLAGALAEYRTELTIMEPLAERDHSNTDWQRFISVVYNKVGYVLQEQDNLSAALAEYRAALDIAQRLAETDSGNAEWQRDLYSSYGKIGWVAYRRKDFPAALDAYEKAEKIALHVKEINPTAASSAKDLAWVQARLEETRRKIAGGTAGNRKK
jgi:tetratricopeptide (TPR) repeat protein